VTIKATMPSRVMLLGGDPTDGRRFIYWNFVASSKEAIEEAAQRWQDDQFPHVPGETERIPLPPRRP
jgi:redox-sensitive bicupin YhaK (pirin superfamily)